MAENQIPSLNKRLLGISCDISTRKKRRKCDEEITRTHLHSIRCSGYWPGWKRQRTWPDPSQTEVSRNLLLKILLQ